MRRASVLIGCWNNAASLPRAIDSILAQTMGDLELIVVDDGSTDETRGAGRRLPRDGRRSQAVPAAGGGLRGALPRPRCSPRPPRGRRGLSGGAALLAPGGLALVSTHGVHVYHPSPPGSGQDFWRWTHSGLERLFSENGGWRALKVSPNRHAIACLGTLFLWYLGGLLDRPGLRSARPAVIAAVNSLVEWLADRALAGTRVPAYGSLSATYLVSASK